MGRSKRGEQAGRKSAAPKKPPAKPPVAGVRARFPATCSLCDRAIPVGAVIKSYGEEWVHKPCWEAAVARNRVLEGETFRSQARPSYRRGNTPGASRKAN